MQYPKKYEILLIMANIKSAKKRIKTAEKAQLRNKAVKSELKTELKKFDTLVADKKFDEASKQLSHVTSLLDQAAQSNVFHQNKANRIKARLSKSVAQHKTA